MAGAGQGQERWEGVAEPLWQRLREAQVERGRALSLAEVVERALYDPECGYYRRARQRVGLGPGHDFYTAASLGEVFAPLIVEALVALLTGAGHRPGALPCVELGPESARGLWEHAACPFAQALQCRAGEALSLPPDAVVFMNEVLDAQPFHRLVWTGERWCEVGVHVDAERPRVRYAWLEAATVDCSALPEAPQAGQVLDVPLGALALWRALLAQQPLLVVTADYGLDWATLCAERPQGTARRYRAHRADTELLRDLGTSDLTHHIAWDWLEDAARAAGYRATLERQEAFLVRHAQRGIAELLRGAEGALAPQRQALMELLHPHHMGARFQVLGCLRGPG